MGWGSGMAVWSLPSVLLSLEIIIEIYLQSRAFYCPQSHCLKNCCILLMSCQLIYHCPHIFLFKVWSQALVICSQHVLWMLFFLRKVERGVHRAVLFEILSYITKNTILTLSLFYIFYPFKYDQSSRYGTLKIFFLRASSLGSIMYPLAVSSFRWIDYCLISGLASNSSSVINQTFLAPY